ncbi:T9SS type A sorting domain-containing protein [Spirosoma soli]|uniref:T9SS type A sorting domain-containing protein n=1 Tax=Spirosoma soli TaxID=1770529 RepID=A0ABW5M6V7_9BACT
MKTFIKSLLVAFTLGVVTFSTSSAAINPGSRPTAAATYKTGIFSTADGKLQIALDKEKTGPVDIKLKNAEGKVLYAQHLGKKEQTARLRLNLSDLPDGAYQIEITNGVDTTTHKLTLSTNQPSTPSRLVAIN